MVEDGGGEVKTRIQPWRWKGGKRQGLTPIYSQSTQSTPRAEEDALAGVAAQDDVIPAAGYVESGFARHTVEDT